MVTKLTDLKIKLYSQLHKKQNLSKVEVELMHLLSIDKNLRKELDKK